MAVSIVSEFNGRPIPTNLFQGLCATERLTSKHDCDELRGMGVRICRNVGREPWEFLEGPAGPMNRLTYANAKAKTDAQPAPSRHNFELRRYDYSGKDGHDVSAYILDRPKESLATML